MWKKDSITFDSRAAFKIAAARMATDRRFPTLLLFISSLLLSACNHQERRVVRSYYFWRNSNTADIKELKYLRQHQVTRLYYKIMDIDWNEDYHAFPVSMNDVNRYAWSLAESGDSNIQVVPVIFITNKTFARLDSAEIPELATRILRKCFREYDSVDIESEKGNYYSIKAWYDPWEIQFDCDWTASTAGKYFYFLQCIRNQLPDQYTSLSATIRLHQYKYPDKTGVPPVDRGMLMVYNISDVTKYAPGNSIFEYDKAKEYFTGNKKYPLPLDIALAAWSWGIVYRDKKFFQIENEMTADTLRTAGFLTSAGNNFYTVKEEKYFYNELLRPGDEIKMESVTDETLLHAAKLARKALNDDSLHVALFELSADEIKAFQHETIEDVYNHFR